MAVDKLNKYIWIVDTINRHGAISRSALSDLWMRSAQGDGRPIPHRSFFAYRRAIEAQLGITIKCNRAHEYYIDSSETVQDEAFRNWVLDSYAMRGLLDDNRDLSQRIHVEPVPSARRFLAELLDAVRECRRISFDYAPFNRQRTETGIIFEPYFVKLFRQRWYMVGNRVADDQLRTYALDRVTDLTPLATTFQLPPGLSADDYFADLFGITQSKAPARDIKMKVDARSAKYLRALPLHHSQREEQFSEFSIFRFRMKLTDDLVRHLLSLGPEAEVLEPKALRLMISQALKDTLAKYE